jgi:hypothetical protein
MPADEALLVRSGKARYNRVIVIRGDVMSAKFRLVCAVSALLCLASPVWAHPAGDRFDAAATVLENKLGPEAENRTPPPHADPEVAKSFADMKASVDELGTDTYPADYDSFMGICQRLNGLNRRYMTAKPANPAVTSDVAFQDDLSPLLVMTTRCMAVHMPFFNQFWAALPQDQRTADRIAGIHQMQGGIRQLLLGLVASSVQPVYSKANRTMLITAGAAYADAFVEALPVADRQSLANQIKANAPDLAKSWPNEAAVVTKALARTDCTGLCTAQ